jgi:N-acyl-D-glucosamine 2-epimerase
MNRTDTFRKEVRHVLETNILNYWQTLKDPNGGFYGEADSAAEIQYSAPRGAILNARIMWAFAAAYRTFKKTEYLVAAVHARDYFLEHFCDHRNGGVYWSVDASGKRLDAKKQLYAQAFGIYGLSELFKATKDDEVLKNAINLFRIVRIPLQGRGERGIHRGPHA